jgi:hypothetical protein
VKKGDLACVGVDERGRGGRGVAPMDALEET